MNALATWAAAPLQLDSAAAEAERVRARAIAAPVLASVFTERALEEFTSRLSFWVGIGLSTASPDMADIRDVLSEAREDLATATQRRAAGDVAGQIGATMAAADLVYRATPAAVAQRLIANAHGTLDARSAAGSARDGDESVRRAERLLRGAQEAIDAGDFALAIRRAYYACQLLRL